jgi:hypothetical protein
VIQILISCDGTWGEEQMACRAALPTGLLDFAAARQRAGEAGWLVSGQKHLCPGHVTAAWERLGWDA